MSQAPEQTEKKNRFQISREVQEEFVNGKAVLNKGLFVCSKVFASFRLKPIFSRCVERIGHVDVQQHVFVIRRKLKGC